MNEPRLWRLEYYPDGNKQMRRVFYYEGKDKEVATAFIPPEFKNQGWFDGKPCYLLTEYTSPDKFIWHLYNTD